MTTDIAALVRLVHDERWGDAELLRHVGAGDPRRVQWLAMEHWPDRTYDPVLDALAHAKAQLDHPATATEVDAELPPPAAGQKLVNRAGAELVPAAPGPGPTSSHRRGGVGAAARSPGSGAGRARWRSELLAPGTTLTSCACHRSRTAAR